MTMRTTRTLGVGFVLAALAGCDGDGTAPSVTCSTFNDPLLVGDVVVLERNVCALLSDAGGTAEYLVVPFTSNFDDAAGYTLGIRGPEISLEPASATATASADDFHARVRRLEARVAKQGLTRASSPRPGLAAVPTLGQVDSFWVIQAIDEIDRAFDDPRPGDFQRVGATLKFIGARTLLYQDDEAPANGLTDADLTVIGQIFDEKLYPLDVQTFGEPSDVDADGMITVLLSPYVNALTPAGETAFIAGFFFPLDVFARNSPGCPICAFSNEREMFYGIVADPTGVFSLPHTTQSVNRILPPVMIHELQHMISFNQRIFLRGALQAEVLWLSEALAHTAEELGGDLFAAEGDQARADDFQDQNFARATLYLESPAPHALTAVDGGGTLQERGAGWLFLRWLGDQYGSDLYGRLTQTTDAGTRNVERQTGEGFSTLLGDWIVTLYTEDLAIPNLPARYQIPKWPLRSILTTGGTYALQPAARTFSSLRTSVLAQDMGASSPYHLLISADGSGDLTLSLNVILASGGLVRRLIVDADGGVALLRLN